MKHIITIALGVALLVEVVAFFGAGIGTGGLPLSTTPTSVGYTETPALEGKSWGDGMSWQVHMDASKTGQPITTAMLPGYQSTNVNFLLQGYTQGDCGNTGQPAFAPGVGADYGYFILQFQPNSGSAQWTGILDGTPVQSTAGGAYAVTANNSGIIWWCFVDSTGHDTWTPGLGQHGTTQGQFVLNHVFSLTGIVPSGKLSISFQGFYTFCGGPSTSVGPVCAAAESAEGNIFAGGSASGGNTFITSSSVNAYSAGASVSILNGAALYNGQTMKVSVTTGYDGPNGYQLQVLCPGPRPCGGQIDPAFGSQAVPNMVIGKTINFPIPANYAINTSVVGWNEIVVVLLANYGPAAQSLSFPVAISPLFQPAPPVITFTTSSSNVYPSIGDRVTLTIFANATNSSAPIGSVSLQVFYVTAAGSVFSAPACGNQWVTNGCPSGTILNVSGGGQKTIATYTFTVNPPLNMIGIVASAISYTTTQQGKVSNPLYITIKPAGCAPGQSCDPTTAGANLWAQIGPALFAAIIVTATVFLAFLVEMPIAFRILVAGAGVGAVLVLVVLGFATWFLPGGPL